VVNVWTVNDVREAKDLAALGVDGIITDVPGEMRAAF
jgi:glycerophosphoryl diester phosphodiesterase